MYIIWRKKKKKNMCNKIDNESGKYISKRTGKKKGKMDEHVKKRSWKWKKM